MATDHESHKRMVEHLRRAAEALERHRLEMTKGVSSHLEESAKIGRTDKQSGG